MYYDCRAYGFRLITLDLHARAGSDITFNITGLTGVLNSVTTPLKEAKIPIFAVSTWLANCVLDESCMAVEVILFRNTDYILLPVDKIGDAVSVLKSDGWIFCNL